MAQDVLGVGDAPFCAMSAILETCDPGPGSTSAMNPKAR
jgi:hypothetical protein